MEDTHHEEHHHEELGFWRKYVFSVDHKVIGIQYAVTGMLFLFFGFCLIMLMRWQLAYPGRALPIIGGLLGDSRMPGGVMARAKRRRPASDGARPCSANGCQCGWAGGAGEASPISRPVSSASTIRPQLLSTR